VVLKNTGGERFGSKYLCRLSDLLVVLVESICEALLDDGGGDAVRLKSLSASLGNCEDLLHKVVAGLGVAREGDVCLTRYSSMNAQKSLEMCVRFRGAAEVLGDKRDMLFECLALFFSSAR